ncbi:orotidine 5'-phosphate decarboxylase [Pseudocyphellaria aurata]|nr:orotidine 5'-phosphate decarboxylase [Pseudocyphellaria aurata]
MTSDHRPLAVPYSARANFPSTPPLARYLLHLISIKRSNLCVSADVQTSSALLQLAEEVGDSICVLQTHADGIDDFSESTIRALSEIASRKMFLIFEDRRFGDMDGMWRDPACLDRARWLIYRLSRFYFVGTVQSQHTRGPLSVATWAHLTSAYLFPGPSIISALYSATATALTSLNRSVFTEITTGTPRPSFDASFFDDEAADDLGHSCSVNPPLPSPSSGTSVVTTTTTITQIFETRPGFLWNRSLSSQDMKLRDMEQALRDLGPPPHARGLLLMAEMSSQGNLITPEYTSSCVSAARVPSDFVIGYISQHALKSGPKNVSLTFAPGVYLPPEGEDEISEDDGSGQRGRSPREAVVEDGADIIIVGRGVLEANDPREEAERYRKKAWEAYEERIGRRNEEDDDD